MHILVVGCGSIGRRHLSNLRQLGVERLSACDIQADRLEQVRLEIGDVETFSDLGAALAARPTASIICPITAYHIPLARQALEAGCHLMIEKPLSHSREGVDELLEMAERQGRVVMVAYSMRFHPGLRQVKAVLDAGRLGKIYSVRASCGQYLPDWHPWEDYRKFYMSKRALGGGAILDISHEIDYLTWFFGDVARVACMYGTLSDLEIDSDDLGEILFGFRSGVIGSLHLDLLQRTYRRTLEVVGSEGTLLWDYVKQQVEVFTVSAGGWESLPYTDERNVVFRGEAQHFLDCLAGRATPLVDGRSGKRTLEIVLAAKRAGDEGRTLAI